MSSSLTFEGKSRKIFNVLSVNKCRLEIMAGRFLIISKRLKRAIDSVSESRSIFLGVEFRDEANFSLYIYR